MPPPTPSTALARSVVGGCAVLPGAPNRLQIDQKIHHIFGSIFYPFWDPLWCHFGSKFVPLLVSDRSWTLIFIKHVDFHEHL